VGKCKDLEYAAIIQTIRDCHIHTADYGTLTHTLFAEWIWRNRWKEFTDVTHTAG
jgi:hypothetical protein